MRRIGVTLKSYAILPKGRPFMKQILTLLTILILTACATPTPGTAPPPPTVNRIELINADNGTVIQVLNNGDSLNVGTLPSKHYKLRAKANDSTTSALLTYDANYNYFDIALPYEICINAVGYDLPANCAVLTDGPHAFKALPLSGEGQGSPFTVTFSATGNAGVSCNSRGMWVWNGREVVLRPTVQDELINLAGPAKVKDLFLYLVPSDYDTRRGLIGNFVEKMHTAGINVWGLEGWRGYFNDSYGPEEFYKVIDSMIAYNAAVPANQKFVGFQADLEPQDGQGHFPPTFHNDIPDSELSTTGGGVWFDTQAQDREMLMRDWLEISQVVRNKLAAAGLQLGSAMPSWTDDYFGEPVMVTYGGSRDEEGRKMMGIVNDYNIMSYNTNLNNVVNRVIGEVTYANGLPAATRPKVRAGIETHKGVGAGISFGDTPGMDNRTTVNNFLNELDTALGGNPSYCGTNIHDWIGYLELFP